MLDTNPFSDVYVYKGKEYNGFDFNTITWEFDDNESLNHIMQKDYLNRFFQLKNNIFEFLKKIIPEKHYTYDKYKIEFDKTYYISIQEYTCGKWKKINSNTDRPFYINGIKDNANEYLKDYGYTFIEFLSKILCINHKVIEEEIIKKYKINCSHENRYQFNYKPCHRIINSSNKKPDFDILKKIYINFPQHINLKYLYSYQNENNEYAFHVGYIEDKYNITYKLPITLWNETSEINPIEKFDILNSYLKIPLFNLPHVITNNTNTLICENERQLDKIESAVKEKFGNKYVVTTWSGGMECTIERTDWSFFEYNDNFITIVTNHTEESYVLSNKIYNKIIKSKHENINFITLNQNLNADLETENIIDLLDKNLFINYSKFCEEAYNRFKLKFKLTNEIEIYTGKQLLALPQKEIKPILSPLINEGNRIMICGSRGTGKSWLAMIIAATIASGGQLFENSDIFRSEKTHKVLYLDGEMSITEEQNRISKIFSNIENGNEGLENIKIINAIQNSELFLFKNLNDVNILKNETKWADVIIIDSVFFFFPDAMGSQFEGAHTLNQFLLKNSTKNITTIIIDHTGKTKSNHSYGTIGKEITLDLIIKLSSTKNSEIDFEITKSRNYKIDESNKKIKYKLIADENNAKLHICKNEYVIDKIKKNASKDKNTKDNKYEEIINYYTKNPKKPIRPAANALKMNRSTLGKNLKKLHEEGKIKKDNRHYYV